MDVNALIEVIGGGQRSKSCFMTGVRYPRSTNEQRHTGLSEADGDPPCFMIPSSPLNRQSSRDLDGMLSPSFPQDEEAICLYVYVEFLARNVCNVTYLDLNSAQSRTRGSEGKKPWKGLVSPGQAKTKSG